MCVYHDVRLGLKMGSGAPSRDARTRQMDEYRRALREWDHDFLLWRQWLQWLLDVADWTEEAVHPLYVAGQRIYHYRLLRVMWYRERANGRRTFRIGMRGDFGGA